MNVIDSKFGTPGVICCEKENTMKSKGNYVKLCRLYACGSGWARCLPPKFLFACSFILQIIIRNSLLLQFRSAAQSQPPVSWRVSIAAAHVLRVRDIYSGAPCATQMVGQASQG